MRCQRGFGDLADGREPHTDQLDVLTRRTKAIGAIVRAVELLQQLGLAAPSLRGFSRQRQRQLVALPNVAQIRLASEFHRRFRHPFAPKRFSPLRL